MAWTIWSTRYLNRVAGNVINLNCIVSKSRLFESGVPQESLLDPLSFIWHTMDLPKLIVNSVVHIL